MAKARGYRRGQLMRGRTPHLSKRELEQLAVGARNKQRRENEHADNPRADREDNDADGTRQR